MLLGSFIAGVSNGDSNSLEALRENHCQLANIQLFFSVSEDEKEGKKVGHGFTS